jgi:hypothetical protein
LLVLVTAWEWYQQLGGMMQLTEHPTYIKKKKNIVINSEEQFLND